MAFDETTFASMRGRSGNVNTAPLTTGSLGATGLPAHGLSASPPRTGSSGESGAGQSTPFGGLNRFAAKQTPPGEEEPPADAPAGVTAGDAASSRKFGGLGRFATKPAPVTGRSADPGAAREVGGGPARNEPEHDAIAAGDVSNEVDHDGEHNRAAVSLRGDFSMLATTSGAQTPQTDEIKAVMNTIRSLARLLSAIAYRPGSAATVEEKAAALESLVEKARGYADRMSEVLNRGRSGRLPRWVRPALHEVAAEALAERWEDGNLAELDPYLQMTEELVRFAGEMLGEAMQEFAENVYHVAHHPDVTAARMLVSVNKAAFVMADAFTDAGVPVADAAPHLQRMTRNILDEVQGSPVYEQVPPDLKVAHAQSMVARLSQLTASEVRAAHKRGEQATSQLVFDGCWQQALQNYRQIEAMAVDSYKNGPVPREEQREKAA